MNKLLEDLKGLDTSDFSAVQKLFGRLNQDIGFFHKRNKVQDLKWLSGVLGNYLATNRNNFDQPNKAKIIWSLQRLMADCQIIEKPKPRKTGDKKDG